ncbi:MAG: hypothetical protein H6834_09620 [Planctomycetes bacterium]|nr:hypothetical protein [Planctomycetota bacterium]
MSTRDDTTQARDLLACHPWLRALARRLVGDEHTADDVVQQTWLRVLRETTERRRTRFATHDHERTDWSERLSGVQNRNVAVHDRGKEIVFLHQIKDGGTTVPTAFTTRASLASRRRSSRAWKTPKWISPAASSSPRIRPRSRRPDLQAGRPRRLLVQTPRLLPQLLRAAPVRHRGAPRRTSWPLSDGVSPSAAEAC